MRIHSILQPRPPALAAALTLLLLAALPGRAHAQADLTFSGGNGAPLSLELNAPVTYVVTAAPAFGSPQFDLQGVGDVFGGNTGGLSLSGTITFTINGGAAQTLSTIRSGFINGNVAATDASLFGAEPGVAVGNTVVLDAGTLTTTGNFAGAPPASGSYPTFLVDAYGQRLDVVNGVAAPEPSTWALLGLGGATALGLTLGQRRRARLLSGLAALLFLSGVLLPVPASAASTSGQTGAQLLQAQLPADTTLVKADCAQLAHAVTLATRAHHADATAILAAALVRNPKKGAHPSEGKLPCACAARLLRASMLAAPDRASALLELASSLCPDCADSFQAVVAVLDDKNPVDGKDSVGPAPAANEPAPAANNGPDGFDTPGDLYGGFGVGFGPGFPGSPGFTGSPPSGAIALPPGLTPVTTTTNG